MCVDNTEKLPVQIFLCLKTPRKRREKRLTRCLGRKIAPDVCMALFTNWRMETYLSRHIDGEGQQGEDNI